MHVCVLILCFLIILYCNKSFVITHEKSKQKFPIQMGYPRMTKFPSWLRKKVKRGGMEFLL